MKCFARILLFLSAAAACLSLYGCGENAHVQAITDAVVSYSDYYIEVKNLGDQVRAQQQKMDPDATSVSYMITVDIPDYTRMDPALASFTLPEPDVASRSANTYERLTMLALRQSLDQYVTQNGTDTYVSLPISFSVNADSEGWSANLTSQSKLDIQQTVETLIRTLLDQNNVYAQNDRLMQAASALSGLLTEPFGGAEYADNIELTGIVSNQDGSISAEFTYPDPQSVYQLLRDEYINSFHQPFYGNERAAQLTSASLMEFDLSSLPRQSATVLLFYDDATQQFSLRDDGGLGKTLSEAKAEAEREASSAVNTAWRVPPIDPPANATVLEGESHGNQIVFQTGASLGTYYYVRFYALTDSDVSEEGVLQLGIFIIGGKSAKLKLPAGYYRVTCDTGESWYGLEHLFGSDGQTYHGDNAIRSRKGYINTISFE